MEMGMEMGSWITCCMEMGSCDSIITVIREASLLKNFIAIFSTCVRDWKRVKLSWRTGKNLDRNFTRKNFQRREKNSNKATPKKVSVSTNPTDRILKGADFEGPAANFFQASTENFLYERMHI